MAMFNSKLLVMLVYQRVNDTRKQRFAQPLPCNLPNHLEYVGTLIHLGMLGIRFQQLHLESTMITHQLIDLWFGRAYLLGIQHSHGTLG